MTLLSISGGADWAIRANYLPTEKAQCDKKSILIKICSKGQLILGL
jgi:hypothetical protein